MKDSEKNYLFDVELAILREIYVDMKGQSGNDKTTYDGFVEFMDQQVQIQVFYMISIS